MQIYLRDIVKVFPLVKEFEQGNETWEMNVSEKNSSRSFTLLNERTSSFHSTRTRKIRRRSRFKFQPNIIFPRRTKSNKRLQVEDIVAWRQFNKIFSRRSFSNGTNLLRLSCVRKVMTRMIANVHHKVKREFLHIRLKNDGERKRKLFELWSKEFVVCQASCGVDQTVLNI